MYRVAALYSGGKDSTYALHWAFLKGFNVVCLITVEPRREDSWMFHYPQISLTRLQAKALGLPHVYIPSSGERDKELSDLKRALEIAVEEFGVEGLVIGALLSDYQRMNINLIAEELGLRVYSPLWRKDQSRYMRELIEFGFKIVITSINVYGLPPKFLGKVLTLEDVDEICRLASIYGFNPAFEGGEAETLVIDAPLYRKRIVIRSSSVVKCSEYSWRLIIHDVELVDK